MWSYTCFDKFQLIPGRNLTSFNGVSTHAYFVEVTSLEVLCGKKNFAVGILYKHAVSPGILGATVYSVLTYID